MLIYLFQRSLMHYRYPLYEKLRKIYPDLNILYAKDQSHNNGKADNYRKLKALNINFKYRDKYYYIPLYPHIVFNILRKRPEVIIMEGSTNIFNNIFIVIAGKIAGSKLIWWDAGRRKGSSPNKLRRLIDPMIFKLIKSCNAVIAYSSLAKEYYTEHGINPDKIFTAYNTIDTGSFKDALEDNLKQSLDIRKKYNLKKNFTIIYVGILEKRKRVEDLLQAFKLTLKDFGDASLLIIGDGPDKENLEEYARSLELKNVYFPGKIVKNTGAYFLASDIYVLPSEGGLGIIEAMFYSLPPIVSSADGTELDLIENGINGFIFNEGNISELASCIKKLMRDEELKLKFIENSRKVLESKFSIDYMIGEICKAINK